MWRLQSMKITSLCRFVFPQPIFICLWPNRSHSLNFVIQVPLFYTWESEMRLNYIRLSVLVLAGKCRQYRTRDGFCQQGCTAWWSLQEVWGCYTTLPLPTWGTWYDPICLQAYFHHSLSLEWEGKIQYLSPHCVMFTCHIAQHKTAGCVVNGVVQEWIRRHMVPLV